VRVDPCTRYRHNAVLKCSQACRAVPNPNPDPDLIALTLTLRQRMAEYSAHDTTLLALAARLGIDIEPPEFAGYFLFELHVDEVNQPDTPYVNFFYNPDPTRFRYDTSRDTLARKYCYFLLLLRHVARVVRREAACTRPSLQSGGLVSRPQARDARLQSDTPLACCSSLESRK